jgi:hypothetical protein
MYCLVKKFLQTPTWNKCTKIVSTHNLVPFRGLFLKIELRRSSKLERSLTYLPKLGYSDLRLVS